MSEKEWRRHDHLPLVITRRSVGVMDGIVDSETKEIDYSALKDYVKAGMITALMREIADYSSGRKKMDIKFFEYCMKLLEICETQEQIQSTSIRDVLADPRKMFGDTVK